MKREKGKCGGLKGEIQLEDKQLPSNSCCLLMLMYGGLESAVFLPLNFLPFHFPDSEPRHVLAELARAPPAYTHPIREC